MKYLLALLFLVGCATKPKYRSGDCLDISAMTITKFGEWNSSAYSFARVQILEVLHTEKMNRFMHERLHNKDFYKIRVLPIAEETNEFIENNSFVIPISDLDGYRYAMQFWELPENNKYNCNAVEHKVLKDEK